MTFDLTQSGLQLRTLVTEAGELELSLQPVPLRELRDTEILVRIEAAPINPSDLGLLTGPADLSTGRASGSAEQPVFTATIPEALRASVASRMGQSLPVGNEGAGTVVAAGSAPEAQALLGSIVAVLNGAMYSQFAIAKAADCLPLPAGTTAVEGASCFVNPLTSLGMVGTMRREGHTALVHTAAASNLGQMLNKVCIAEGIGLVNIVRSAEQAALLRGIGAVHVVDSTAPTFKADLVDAIAATGATLAFDAIGGGRLAGQILTAMEAAVNRNAGAYSRYGSTTHKQVYIYGGLDTRPTEFNRGFGMAWGVGGWLLTPFLQKIGAEATKALRQRVASELKTTFSSHYTREISLAEALQPGIIADYSRRATGEKFLINPSKVSN